MPAVSRNDVVRYSARVIPWLPPLAAAVVATVVIAVRHGQAETFPLQIAAVLLASGIGYALDDPAFEVLAASPTSYRRRRLQRLSIVLPPTVVLYAALLVWQGTAGPEETLAFVAMATGLMGMAVGIAGVASRRSPRGLGGIAVAPALFAALILSTMLPPRWRPLPIGDIPGGWLPIYLRWSAAALVGVLVLAVSSRDRAGRIGPDGTSRSQ